MAFNGLLCEVIYLMIYYYYAKSSATARKLISSISRLRSSSRLPIMKICSKCNIEKSKSLFYKDTRNKEGLKKACKKCTVPKNSLLTCSRCKKKFIGSQQKKFCSKECLGKSRIDKKNFVYGIYKLPDTQ